MATIVIGNREELDAQKLTSMYDFRHEVFVRRLGWSLPMRDEVECDNYDSPAATYFLVCNENKRVTACARLIPTTISYMLPDLFPQLLGETPAPRDPAIWELSRFAVDVHETSDRRVLALSKLTLALLSSVVDFARSRSATRLTMVTSVAIERLMLRERIQIHRIAPPALIGGTHCIALFMEVRASDFTSPVRSILESAPLLSI